MSQGSVFRSGKGWAIKYDGPPDPATGDRRQKLRRGFPTKKAAQDALSTAVSAVAHGMYLEPSQDTVSVFAGQWLTTIAATVKPTTLEQYRRYLKLHVVPRIGGLPLGQVSPRDLNMLYASLREHGRADGKGGLSVRTVRLVHAVVHRMFRDAVRWEQIPRNPADSADPPRATGGKAHKLPVWTAHELRTFLDACRASDDPWLSLWTFLATTGARRAEGLGLRWADIDFDAGHCRIVQQVVLADGVLMVDTPKTTSSARPIALDATTVAVLREHRRRQSEVRLMMGPGWHDHGLVWCRPTGEPLRPKRVNELLKGSLRGVDVPPLSPHGLRHTWATLALESGVPAKVVADRLGHTRIGTTLDIYTHSTPVMHRDAADTVAALIFGAD